jgi:hypothetical protein
MSKMAALSSAFWPLIRLQQRKNSEPNGTRLNIRVLTMSTGDIYALDDFVILGILWLLGFSFHVG